MCEKKLSCKQIAAGSQSNACKNTYTNIADCTQVIATLKHHQCLFRKSRECCKSSTNTIGEEQCSIPATICRAAEKAIHRTYGKTTQKIDSQSSPREAATDILHSYGEKEACSSTYKTAHPHNKHTSYQINSHNADKNTIKRDSPNVILYVISL